MNSSRRTIAIDTAKRVFFLHGENEFGKVILREKLTRERLLPYLANQPASTIAIEAGFPVPIIGAVHSPGWVMRFE